MELYALIVYNEKHQIIYNNYNLQHIPFMFRMTAKTTIELTAEKAIQNVKPDVVYKINEKVDDMQITIYGYSSKTTFIVIANDIYPPYVIYSLIHDLKICNLDKTVLNDLWMKYKNAKDVDKIQQIKSDLDETKTIMMDSIDSLFQRGEQLEVLVDKAEELEKASELLQIKTKKLNSCCPLF